MMNIKSSLNKVTFTLLILLLAGCAGTKGFDTYEAQGLKHAWEGIKEQRTALKSFHANVEFNVDTERGSFRLKGKITYNAENNYHIVLNGPLGIRLAEVEINSSDMIVEVPSMSIMREINLHEKLEIPELDITIQNPKQLPGLLLPVLSINNPNSWEVSSSHNDNDSELIVVTNADGNKLELKMNIALSPLKLKSETFYQNGEQMYHRDIIFSTSQSGLADMLHLDFNQFTIDIKYNYRTVDIVKTEV